ncbi:hypothetical protein ABHI18_009362, partial [Aspergillus niger]
NATVGSLVAVSATTIPQTIYDYNGNKVSSVKYKVLSGDESNTPGNSTSLTSSSNSSSTSSSSSSSSSGSGSSSDDSTSGSSALSAPFMGVLTGATLFAVFML